MRFVDSKTTPKFRRASGLRWIEPSQSPQEGDAFWDEATMSFHVFNGGKWEILTHDISWHTEKMQQQEQQRVLAQFTGGDEFI